MTITHIKCKPAIIAIIGLNTFRLDERMNVCEIRIRMLVYMYVCLFVYVRVYVLYFPNVCALRSCVLRAGL